MLINIKLADILDVGRDYTKNLPLAFSVGTLFIYELFTIIPSFYNNASILDLPIDLLNYFNGLFFVTENSPQVSVNLTQSSYGVDSMFSSFLQIEALGLGLYTYGALWLILTSVILLLAMLAPISIVHSKPKQTPLNKSTNNSPFSMQK